MIRISTFIRKTEGATAVIIAISIFALLGVVSLAIDMGHLYTVRNQLQNVADAAALAGVSQLIQADSSGNAVRNSTLATTAAKQVAQSQSQLDGLPTVADEARNDLAFLFGVWDIYAGTSPTNDDLPWTPIGAVVDSTNTTANALRVTITRDSGTVFGPVTNLFAQIFGLSTSVVGATATAYLGYSNSAAAGTVTVPLTVPASVLAGMQTQSDSWFARLFAPRPAQATSNSLTFKDLGGSTFYNSDTSKPYYDTTKAYLFTVNTRDTVPDTVVNNLKKYYTTGGTAVRTMARGTRLYPLSEYYWASNNKTIFSAFKSAYNAKKDGNNNWLVNVPVYSTTNPVARHQSDFLWRLARNLFPGVTEAQACFTFPASGYPSGGTIYVSGFTNLNVTGVTYDSTCATDSGGGQVTNPNSCRNTNSVSVTVATGVDTVSPPGSTGGGPNNQHITGGTQAGGALGREAKLTK